MDEAALADALRSGNLAGAALEVFETEPLRSCGRRLCRFAEPSADPHIAGVTNESTRRDSQVTMANVRAVLEGRACPSG